MIHLVDFPTRVNGDYESGIDNAVTKIPKCNFKREGVVTLLSDHDKQIIELLHLKRNANEKVQFIKKKRDVSEKNIQLFTSLLEK